MKNIILYFVVIFFAIGCEKDNHQTQICASETCKNYYQIWKQPFIERNQMSVDYFNNHIIPYHTAIHSWQDGESFEVKYKIRIDWAESDNADQFIINIKDESRFPHVKVPRKTYLNKDEIAKTVYNYAFQSEIGIVKPINQLKYDSERKAIKALEEKSGYKKIKSQGVIYYEQKPSHTANGHPFLKGVKTISNQDNKCLYAQIDLETGAVEWDEAVCHIE